MELSKRLKAIAEMVDPGSRIVDVGTDHGHLPIALVQQKKAVSAIAGDISPASVKKAEKAVAEAGLSDTVSVRQADGLDCVNTGEADTVIISGMGGALIISILASSGVLLREFEQLILSPQSEVASVREWLYSNGFPIVDEAVAEDRGKVYMIIKAKQGTETEKPDETQLAYGPVLISRKDPALADYLAVEISRLNKIINALGDDKTERLSSRREELMKEKERVCAVLNYLIS